MKNFQRIILGILLVSPVIAGVLLVISSHEGTKSTVSSMGFKKLGLIEVNGVIVESESFLRQLRQMREDNGIAGVLLRVNSPGGATAPSQEMYQAVKKFQKAGKPIVVSMGSVAASGGYYISSPARTIFAAPGTLTGSIGVIMTVPLYKELAKKIGIEMQTYKAGDFKDLASPYRTMSKREQNMIQELLEDTHDQFITDVADARCIDRDSLVHVADGRIFTGRQALYQHLIDTLGGYEEALSYLRTITGCGNNARLVSKRETSSTIKEWFMKEMIQSIPFLYRVMSPIGTHCIAEVE